MRYSCGVLSLFYLIFSGCTHVQLRHNSVQHASTQSDIYQQQVLDNLAKFARDPHSLPHFSVVSGGLNDVTDNAGADLGLNWNATRFVGAALGFGASRTAKENWSLVPVSDPRKLELMRCAYQQAVGCGCQGVCSDCLDCQKRFNNFYSGDINKIPPHPLDPTAPGAVTSQCLSSGWLEKGCTKCFSKIRKKNPCCLSGSYCDCTVWVTPGCGTDELSKLTIAILDYALNDPPGADTKEVIVYLDAEGGPANSGNAVFAIKGQITTETDVHKILSERELGIFNKRIPERQLLEQLKQQQKLLPTTSPEELPPGPKLQLQQSFQKKLKAIKGKEAGIIPQGSTRSVMTPQHNLMVPPTPVDQLFMQELQRVGAGF